MATNTPHLQPISAAVVGGIVVLLAVIGAAGYLVLISTKPVQKKIAPQSHPTQVLNSAFSENGVFVKTKSLKAAGSSTPVTTTPSNRVGAGDIGKTDITAFE